MSRFHLRSIASACVIAIILGCVGCRSGDPSTGFEPTRAFTSLVTITSDWRRGDSDQGIRNALSVLETDQSLADTVRIAREAEATARSGDPQCTALFAQVALDCWPMLQAPDGGEELDEIAAAAWEIYHHSVAQFVRHANIHSQIDPGDRVAFLTRSGESSFIPITHHGFPWSKGDFSEFHLAAQTHQKVLERYWMEPGLGVPLVVVRRRETSEGFLGRDVRFAATCILRPRTTKQDSQPMDNLVPAESEQLLAAVLELQDPLRVKQVAYENRPWNLARDLSAPLALASCDTDRDAFSNFLNPARVDERGGLRMIEPYQPGKIPIVFVHGLLSDKFTWVDLVNDLRAVDGLSDRFQIWAFQYPTGQPFIRSAAEMRIDLGEIVRMFDPDGDDPALTQIVLVGHSMGGLVSKLQVSHSQSTLWDSVATRRLEDIEASHEIRNEIQQLFFFEPVPSVSRVVFIGTPHRGSAMANGLVGKLGSALVMTPSEKESRFKAIVRANPDVFNGDLARRLPSSIDLLRLDNPMLLATYKLSVDPRVRLHAIIGNGRKLKDGTPADGVVTVQSARHPGTISELQIDTTHTRLTSHPETTAEILRILSVHLSESKLPVAPVSLHVSLSQHEPLAR